jgi:transcriptional regulator with XRE-family HTH domain
VLSNKSAKAAPGEQPSHTYPDDKMREQGRRFAEWLQDGLKAQGWRKRDLNRASGISDTYIGILAQGGIGTNGIYQRPSPQIIERMAAALGADEDKGRVAAGYEPRPKFQSNDIRLQHGNRYRFFLDDTGTPLEIELTPELRHQLELVAALQRYRRGEKEDTSTS